MLSCLLPPVSTVSSPRSLQSPLTVPVLPVRVFPLQFSGYYRRRDSHTLSHPQFDATCGEEYSRLACPSADVPRIRPVANLHVTSFGS